MRDSERYRRRADEAERLARETSHPDHRRHLEQIAADWRAMAEQAARAEHKDDDPAGR